MTTRTELRLALAALVVGTAGTAWALLAPVPVATDVLTAFVAPGLLVLAGASAVRRKGVLGRRGALLATVLGLLALVCAVGAGTAWDVGFDEADAGVQQGPLAAAWLPLLATGWLLGTAALAPALSALFHDVRSRPARMLLSAWVAAVIAVALGIALALPVFAAIASIAALFLLTWRRDAQRPAPADRGAPWPPRVLTALAAATLVCGAASLVVAFTGSAWPGFPGDGTRAMNVGLALAGISAVPLTVAGGVLLRTLPRHRRSLAPAFGVAAVLTSSAAQAAGAGGTMQEPLLLIGAALVGVAGALVALPAMPPFGAWQPVVGVALAVGLATAVGFPVVAAGPVLAPLVAGIGLVLLRRRSGAVTGTGARSQPSARVELEFYLCRWLQNPTRHRVRGGVSEARETLRV